MLEGSCLGLGDQRREALLMVVRPERLCDGEMPRQFVLVMTFSCLAETLSPSSRLHSEVSYGSTNASRSINVTLYRGYYIM
jgi:hypothetical protein